LSRILWFAGWTGVAIWSLFAFAVYGFLDVIGGAAMRHADLFSSDPETVEWIFRAFGWVRGLSTSLTLIVWGIVSLAILSVPWLFGRLASNLESVGPDPRRARQDGIIDLAPGEYAVRPTDEGRPGSPVPRIGPTRF
jgi:hypothetical protein